MLIVLVDFGHAHSHLLAAAAWGFFSTAGGSVAAVQHAPHPIQWTTGEQMGMCARHPRAKRSSETVGREPRRLAGGGQQVRSCCLASEPGGALHRRGTKNPMQRHVAHTRLHCSSVISALKLKRHTAV
ncbi:hypothetical protein GQ54DRAFT_39113 [Martensiomyces pterosporus]|nr:hypothetical protein GQ54DRAFT_39113 [Martensiomyces pterosporus]